MKKPKPLVLIGAGGHAKVVLEALRSIKRPPAACLDGNREIWGSSLEGVRVVGGDELLDRYPPARYALVLGVGLPRPGSARRGLFEALRARGYEFPPVAAASALISRSASLASGAQVLTRAVVHPGASIGANVIVNTGAIVEHDAVVGEHAHICPGAVLCGGAQAGPGAFVGAGAVLLPYVRVGAGALVAAGVVARKELPDGGKLLP